MNNAVYGRTTENVRNTVDVRLVSNEKEYLKWTSKLSFAAQKVFDNDLVVIHKYKTTLTFNKPACVGICTLELSIVSMYEFHYNYIKNKYGNKSRLIFTDTGSLTQEIETENVYEDFTKNKYFDFSNYSVKSKYYDDSNALVVDELKDKMGGVATEEFAGLKPKMSLFLLSDSSEYKKKKMQIKMFLKQVIMNIKMFC